jgi:hypothetical protein
MSFLLGESWDGYGQTNGAAPSATIEEKWDLDRTAADIEDGQTGKSIEPGTQLVASKTGRLGNHEYLTLGFAYKHDGLNTLSFVGGFLDGGSVNINIIITTTGELAVRKGSDSPFATGTTQLSSGVWYWIEIYARTHNTLGEYELRIDGDVEISGTGLNTRDGSNNYSNRVFFSGGSLNAKIDDVYVNNDTGGNFYGPCYVEHLRPTADDTETWTPSAGTDNYALVNEAQSDGDTTYVETSGANTDLYQFTSLVGTGEIFGIQINAHAKTDTAQFQFAYETDSTTENGSTKTLTSAYLCYSEAKEVDSNTDPFTNATFNAGRYGYTRIGGTPRITRVDIDVVYSQTSGPAPIEEEVTSDLGATLGHTVEDDLETNNILESASSVLDLTSVAIQFGDKQLTADDSEITFDHSLSYIGPITVEVSSVISFTDRAYKTAYGDAESELTLTDEAVDESFVYAKLLPEGMYPGGVYSPFGIPTFPPDLLTLVQSVAYSGSASRSVASALELTQSVTVTQAVINKSVSSLISFSEVLGRPIDASASSVLSLVGDAEIVQSEESVLSLSGEAIGVPVKGTESEMTLTHVLERVLVGLKLVSSDLNINHSVLYYSARLAQECTYSPQIGFSGSGIVAPPATSPTLGNATLTLTYPEGAPTMTVVLRNPNFGNVDKFNFMRIKTVTRGGSLLVYANPDWPKERVFSITVDALRQTQVDELRALITASLGKEVGLLNHENRYWKGLITTPDLDITQIGRNAYSVSFEFEDTGPDVELPPP